MVYLDPVGSAGIAGMKPSGGSQKHHSWLLVGAATQTTQKLQSNSFWVPTYFLARD